MAFMKDIVGAYLVVFALLFFSMHPLLGWFTCKVLTYPRKTFSKWIFGGIMIFALPLASTIASFFPTMDGFEFVGLMVLFFLGLSSALWCILELLLRKFKNNTTSKKHPPIFWFILWILLIVLIFVLPLFTALDIADNGVKSGKSNLAFLFSCGCMFLSPAGVLSGITAYAVQIITARQIQKRLKYLQESDASAESDLDAAAPSVAESLNNAGAP